MNHLGTQELVTSRLKLRKIIETDAEMVYRWMSDPEVCKYERWTPHKTVSYSRGFIKEVFTYDSPSVYEWGIEYKNQLVGSVSIVDINDFDQKAVLGYCIAKDFWSKGITTEAVQAVLAYMFSKVGINRIEANHSINNPASGRVLEKAGMKLEGYAKEYYFSNSDFQDSKLYGLTKTQYFSDHTD